MKQMQLFLMRLHTDVTKRYFDKMENDMQGYNAKLENVELVITVFRDGLKQQNFVK